MGIVDGLVKGFTGDPDKKQQKERGFDRDADRGDKLRASIERMKDEDGDPDKDRGMDR